MRTEIRSGDLIVLDIKNQEGVDHPLCGVHLAFAVDYEKDQLVIANPLNIDGCAKIVFNISDAKVIHPFSFYAILAFGFKWCQNFRQTWNE